MSSIEIKKTRSIPSFKGKHNGIKVKCWLLLYDRYSAGENGLKLAEMAMLSGAHYKSLSTLITRWVRWHYLGFHKTRKGREYRILTRGIEWLERWKEFMPLQRYRQELESIADRRREQSMINTTLSEKIAASRVISSYNALVEALVRSGVLVMTPQGINLELAFYAIGEQLGFEAISPKETAGFIPAEAYLKREEAIKTTRIMLTMMRKSRSIDDGDRFIVGVLVKDVNGRFVGNRIEIEIIGGLE